MCLVDIESTEVVGDVTWINRTVYDAFERTVYGKYMWHTDPVKKYWEVPPFMCRVKLVTGENVICKSSDEFNELINRNFGMTLG
jgi:hypothetical protein